MAEPTTDFQAASPLAATPLASETGTRGQPRPHRRVPLAPVVLAGFAGALLFAATFNVPRVKVFRNVPSGLSGERLKQFAEETDQMSLDLAKKDPGDKFWRAVAGPWSDLDRWSDAGRRKVVLLGAIVGVLFGGVLSLIVAGLGPPATAPAWYDSLPLMGTCLSAVLMYVLIGLGVDRVDLLNRYWNSVVLPYRTVEPATALLALAAAKGAIVGYAAKFICRKHSRPERASLVLQGSPPSRGVSPNRRGRRDD